MRKQLEPAPKAATLADVLSKLGQADLAGFLAGGAGFRINVASPGIKMEPVADVPGRYRFTGTDLVADVAIEVAGEYGVAVQTVTLTNTGAQPSPALDELNAVFLPLKVRLRDQPQACGFGGGLTQGYYPPLAYRPLRVGFGQARDWDPTNKTFSRWWTTRRHFTLASNPDGRSTNPYMPLLQFGWQGPNGEMGIWAAIEWSGRWSLEATTEADWEFFIRGGPTVKKMLLGPGESIRLPRVHVGVYGAPGQSHAEGLNRVRRYVADVLSPDVEGGRPWPYVAYHHWFGIDATLTDAIIRRQADRAAELGVEYFEVDAGWYHSAPGAKFWEGLGNWDRVNAEKFPDGLEVIAEHVRAKGMKFGLWFEPERARTDSSFYKAHPEWFWPTSSPINVMVNLTRRDAQDGVIELLSGWISKLDIRWLRWDNNQALGPIWDSVDPTGKVQFAYMEGLYRIFDTLVARHPNLIIDNCAGGGQRSDFGTLRRSATMVPSDHADDPHIVRIMQTAGARILPANYMNGSFYVGQGEADAVTTPLNVISRMSGAMSFSGHIADMSARQVKRVRKLLDGYRTFRHLLMKDFYALTAYPATVADWDVVQFADSQTAEAVVLAYRVAGEQDAMRVYPKGLDAGREYEVVDPFSPRRAQRAKGAELMSKGLRLKLEKDSALVRHLKPVA